MEEQWKDIEGYEGKYQVSDLGRVRSLDRTVHTMRFGKPCDIFFRGTIIRQVKRKNGYMKVGLYRNNELKTFNVHRLVAIAFIPNSQNLPCINHKDEDKANNRADNLEWCTYLYNNNYGNHSAKQSASHFKRPVAMFTMDGTLERTFPSLIDAARYIGNPKFDNNISLVCDGKSFSRYGHRWSYIIDGNIQPPTPPKTDEQRAESNRLKSQNSGRKRGIVQLDIEGNVIAEYDSIAEAARTVGIGEGNIRHVANGNRNTCGGYRWKYKE